MDLIDKFRSYLEQFDYPNINFLDDEQIAHLFTSANKKVMLTWLIQKLSPTIVLPSEWKSAEHVIAEYLYENGFCNSSQKHLFVSGNASVSIKEEIAIFERIFEYLSIICKKNIPSLTTTKYNIKSLINIDLNLFPTLGPQKLLHTVEKQQKIDKYKSNIAELERSIERVDNGNVDLNLNSSITTEINTQKIDIASFHSKAMKLQEIASTLNKVNGDQSKAELDGLNPEIENSLKTCAADSVEVVQYLKNLNISFPPIGEELNRFDTPDQSEMYDLTVRNARLASEMTKTLDNE